MLYMRVFKLWYGCIHCNFYISSLIQFKKRHEQLYCRNCGLCLLFWSTATLLKVSVDNFILLKDFKGPTWKCLMSLCLTFLTFLCTFSIRLQLLLMGNLTMHNDQWQWNCTSGEKGEITKTWQDDIFLLLIHILLHCGSFMTWDNDFTICWFGFNRTVLFINGEWKHFIQLDTSSNIRNVSVHGTRFHSAVRFVTQCLEPSHPPALRRSQMMP